MGQVPSFPQSSVKSPPFPRPHFSSPATTFLAPQVCFITALYLNVVNAWILFYLGQSFHFSVPWEQCPLLKNSSGFGEEEVQEKGETEVEGNLEEEKGMRRKKRQVVEGRRNERKRGWGRVNEEGNGHPV